MLRAAVRGLELEVTLDVVAATIRPNRCQSDERGVPARRARWTAVTRLAMELSGAGGTEPSDSGKFLEPDVGGHLAAQLSYSSGSVVKSNGYPLLRPASVAVVALVSATSFV